MTRDPKRYRAIAVWGQILGSYPYYIHEQQHRAASDDAPEDAIYRDQDGHWHTVRDVSSKDTKAEILRRLYPD